MLYNDARKCTRIQVFEHCLSLGIFSLYDYYFFDLSSFPRLCPDIRY